MGGGEEGGKRERRQAGGRGLDDSRNIKSNSQFFLIVSPNLFLIDYIVSDIILSMSCIGKTA